MNKHYSEQIIDELVANFGWKRSDVSRQDETVFITKTLVDNHARGGQLNPEGVVTVNANFCDRGRYLQLNRGFEVEFDMDCRDREVKRAAKEFNDKVEKLHK
jgi:hypothetical protein